MKRAVLSLHPLFPAVGLCQSWRWQCYQYLQKTSPMVLSLSLVKWAEQSWQAWSIIADFQGFARVTVTESLWKCSIECIIMLTRNIKGPRWAFYWMLWTKRRSRSPQEPKYPLNLAQRGPLRRSSVITKTCLSWQSFGRSICLAPARPDCPL